MFERRDQLRKIADYFKSATGAYLEDVKEPHSFIRRFLSTVGWSSQDFIDFIRRRQDAFVSRIENENLTNPPLDYESIQQNCHKIWLTAPSQPHLPPSDYLIAYFKMCKAHPLEWTHFFWTNSDDVARYLEFQASAAGAKILVQNINSLQLGKIEKTLQALIADQKFVLAADIMKFVVLDRFGGIYSDLGICFDNAILSLVSAASYTFILAPNMFFQTSWISCRKGSHLSRVFLGILNNPEVFSRSYALEEANEVTAGTEVHTFCGLGYTACVLLFLPTEAPIIVFPPHSPHLTWRSQQSWYGTVAKHGNALIRNSKPSVVSLRKYLEYEDLASSRISVINCNGMIQEKVNVIAKLFDYFQNSGDPLCRYFAYYGSLKCSSWHNYGCVFFLIMEGLSAKRISILEISDARELWGSSANGEKEFGGSVRAFEAHFGASVSGIEINRSQQNSFSLNSTVVINRSHETSLSEHLSRHHYDVIIDNGIHQFDKSLMVLELGLSKLNPSGIYFIEAVPTADIPRWKEYFFEKNFGAAIFSLPKEENTVDNCVIAIFT
jgi:hypothetical protein